MLIISLFSAVEQREFVLDDSTCMDSMPFWRVYLYDTQQNSRCKQVNNIAFFSWNQNTSSQYWRSRQEGRNKQPCQTNTYR